MTKIDAAAQALADKIIDNVVKQRRGFSAAWDCCGPDIQLEIRQEIAEQLAAELEPDQVRPENYWGEDPDFPHEDWQLEVANNDTRLGYWQWVESERESRDGDEQEAID